MFGADKCHCKICKPTIENHIPSWVCNSIPYCKHCLPKKCLVKTHTSAEPLETYRGRLETYREVFVDTIEKPEPVKLKFNFLNPILELCSVFTFWFDEYFLSIVSISVTLMLIILTSISLILTNDSSSLFTQGSPKLDDVICFLGYFSLCTWCPAGVILSLEALQGEMIQIKQWKWRVFQFQV